MIFRITSIICCNIDFYNMEDSLQLVIENSDISDECQLIDDEINFKINPEDLNLDQEMTNPDIMNFDLSLLDDNEEVTSKEPEFTTNLEKPVYLNDPSHYSRPIIFNNCSFVIYNSCSNNVFNGNKGIDHLQKLQDYKKIFKNLKELDKDKKVIKKVQIYKFEEDKNEKYMILRKKLLVYRQKLEAAIVIYCHKILQHLSTLDKTHTFYALTNEGMIFLTECLKFLSSKFIFRPFYYLSPMETIQHYDIVKKQLGIIMKEIPLGYLMDEIQYNVIKMSNLDKKEFIKLKNNLAMARMKISRLEHFYSKICDCIEELNKMIEQQPIKH